MRANAVGEREEGGYGLQKGGVTWGRGRGRGIRVEVGKSRTRECRRRLRSKCVESGWRGVQEIICEGLEGMGGDGKAELQGAKGGEIAKNLSHVPLRTTTQ
jgi:hypothetical protein